MKFFWTPEEEHDYAMLDSHERKPGQIRFDERGNAVYEWTDPKLSGDGRKSDQLRAKALGGVELSLVDDDFGSTTTVNEKGARLGYNPYESGMIPKARNKVADLRQLSQWIETKRRLEAAKRGKG